MKLSSIKYYLSTAFRNIVRNRLMAVASILTVASCVFILSIAYCIASNVTFLLKQVEDTIGITIFILDDATADQVNAMYEEICGLEQVDSENVKYISAEMALERFRETLGDSGGVLSGFEDDNPLPRSFEITLRDITTQKAVLRSLGNLDSYGVEKVSHMQDITEILININSAVQIVSVIVITCLGVLAVVIIMNTIKITVNTRKTEINIMKFVGATDWFIRWPFILEGALIGLIGAIIPIIISFFGYNGLIDMISNSILGGSNLMEFQKSSTIFPVLIPIAVLLGIAIGTIGSVDAIRKHLKV